MSMAVSSFGSLSLEYSYLATLHLDPGLVR